MNPLDRFTVERLEELADENTLSNMSFDELLSLAKIALAAKQAKPIGEVKLGGYDDSGHRSAKVVCLHDQADWDNFPDRTKLYLLPPGTCGADGWVLVPKKLTDRMASAIFGDVGLFEAGKFSEWYGSREALGENYLAMLAAAPKP